MQNKSISTQVAGTNGKTYTVTRRPDTSREEGFSYSIIGEGVRKTYYGAQEMIEIVGFMPSAFNKK